MTQRESSARHFVGVEVGRNKIIASIFDPTLRRMDTVKRSTKAERGPDAVAARVVRCVQDVADEADAQLTDIRAVGVGAPGSVLGGREQVVRAPRWGWRDFPLGEMLREALGLPVIVASDGDLATLGVYAVEWRAKPGRLLGVFLGSSIVGGLIADGRLQSGAAHGLDELGHRVLDPKGPPCPCGRRGCFEMLAGRSAILRYLRAAIEGGRATLLKDTLETADRLRGRDLRQAYRRGDELVGEAVQSTSRWIGVALANLVEALCPDVVVLGGGIMEDLGDVVLPPVLAAANAHRPSDALSRATLLTSTSGDLASATGAAWLARSLAG